MNSQERLVERLIERGYGERLRYCEPLSRYTTFAIGGPADLLVVAKTLHELSDLVQLAHQETVPCLLLGNGSNVLVADAGFRGLVVVNACDAFGMEDGDVLIAESGVPISRVARWTVEHGWSGLDWAVGVPGTVGGAIVGNAGAYGGCVADCLEWVDLLQPDGNITRTVKDALEYAYRTSALKRIHPTGHCSVVLKGAFQLSKGDPDDLVQRARVYTEQRKVRTPEGRCAGSIFKRTMQYPAGFLIEQAGLKGRRIGDAQVSEQHANFVMNVGDATAADVRALMELIQRTVWDSFAQQLEPEIELVGDWDAA